MENFLAFYLHPIYLYPIYGTNDSSVENMEPIKLVIHGLELNCELKIPYMEFIKSIGNRLPLAQEMYDWLETTVVYSDKFVITKNTSGDFKLAKLEERRDVLTNIFYIDDGEFYKKIIKSEDFNIDELTNKEWYEFLNQSSEKGILQIVELNKTTKYTSIE
jgi:hypothetical protein